MRGKEAQVGQKMFMEKADADAGGVEVGVVKSGREPLMREFKPMARPIKSCASVYLVLGNVMCVP